MRSLLHQASELLLIIVHSSKLDAFTCVEIFYFVVDVMRWSECSTDMMAGAGPNTGKAGMPGPLRCRRPVHGSVNGCPKARLTSPETTAGQIATSTDAGNKIWLAAEDNRMTMSSRSTIEV